MELSIGLKLRPLVSEELDRTGEGLVHDLINAVEPEVIITRDYDVVLKKCVVLPKEVMPLDRDESKKVREYWNLLCLGKLESEITGDESLTAEPEDRIFFVRVKDKGSDVYTIDWDEYVTYHTEVEVYDIV